jgi:hypothetical protein
MWERASARENRAWKGSPTTLGIWRNNYVANKDFKS